MTVGDARPRRVWRWIAVMAAVALFVTAMQRVGFSRVWTELSAVHGGWLALACLCYFTILPLWSLQWQLLAPPDAERPFGRMFGVVAVTSTVLNTTPMLVGEAAGVVLLVTRAGLSRAAALSVLAMDQLLVGLAKLTVLATAAVMLPLPLWMTSAALSMVLGVLLLLAALLFAAWRHTDLERWVDSLLPPRWQGRLGALGAALAPMRSPARSGATLLLALAKKGVEILAILCVQRAFGLSLPLTSAVLVLATLNVATLLPVIPGNLGVYEAVVALVYTQLGVPAEQALGMGVVQHAVYLGALALPGIAWMHRLDRRERFDFPS